VLVMMMNQQVNADAEDRSAACRDEFESLGID
jgi:hypothetical protein